MLDDKQVLLDVLKQELECAKQEKEMAEGQESKLLTELGRLRQNISQEEDRDRLYILELLEEKKGLLRQVDELHVQLGHKDALVKEMETKYDQQRD